MNYKDYFKGKKITVLGLGILGRGINDVKFLADCDADLIVTDLKSKKDLAESLAQLADYSQITYVLGEHRLEDFRGRDLILKASGVPLDSLYIAEARAYGIPIEMDESLFFKLAPPDITLIGVTGTRGKTTTTALIYEILKKAHGEGTVHLAGNIRGLATLPLLATIQPKDIVVLELSSWQLQGFGESKISPHIAVFTNLMPDHLNYYKNSMDAYFDDKAQIFANQGSHNFLIMGEEVAGLIEQKFGKRARAKKIVAGASSVPKEWKPLLRGTHNKENIALAVAVGEVLKVPLETIHEVVESFSGVEGRMQYVRTVRGVEIYNDTTATTADATLVALKTLAHNKNIVLIMGGADKTLDMSSLLKNISQYCSTVVLLAGTGSLKIQKDIMQIKNIGHCHASSLTEAVTQAMNNARTGDVILFSPAFASFGMFKNEFDRGEQFMALVSALE
ncbi:UDP-N-acetylmuramoyl-L-alanine--D-glutamate ligase [Patescibacteria group bacterium]|nr:MAG: UDP-N-acetylmuramoyl-L-alanine--D-glutamate ligase [Patescibacteria group bacterium]